MVKTSICSYNLANTDLRATTTDVVHERKETCMQPYRQKYYSQLKQWKQQRCVGKTILPGCMGASEKPDILAQVTNHAYASKTMSGLDTTLHHAL